MDKNVLRFCFKGERNYVQGPDIFNGLMRHCREVLQIPSPAKIDVSFHRQASKNLQAEHYIADVTEKPVEACVVFKYESNGERHWVVLTETAEAIGCRNPYDEDSLVSRCAIRGTDNSICLAGESPFTLIETIVAMNKALHLATIKGVRKWLFVRAQFNRWGEQRGAAITVKIISNFNNKLTRSDVVVGGQHIGSIYFSMAE